MRLNFLLFILAIISVITIMSYQGSAYALWTITNDATGGDCTKIGTWKGTTCSLTKNLTSGINITSNGIIINGSGHAVTGNNQGDGVSMLSVSQVTVRDLDISQFGTCVYIEKGSDNSVLTSKIHQCEIGVLIIDEALSNKITNNEIHHNNQEGVLINQAHSNEVKENNIHDNAIGPAPSGGIDVINNAQKNVLENNQVKNNNGFGIEFSNHADSNSAIRNQISNPTASWGVRIEDSDNNLVIFNSISKEIQDGVLIQNGKANNIFCNDVSSHTMAIGIDISPGTKNNVIMNNFLESDDGNVGGVPAGANTFAYAKPIGGNYWEVYSPTCKSSDGKFCDNPHKFAGDQDDIPWKDKVPWKLNEAMCLNNGKLVTPPSETLPPPEEIPVVTNVPQSGDVLVYFLVVIAISIGLGLFGVLHSRSRGKFRS